ncbi:hypothetical protein IIA16_02195 [bacterium]|nr:hypothetical protein [bacterium]
MERLATLAIIAYFFLMMSVGSGGGGPGAYLWAQSSADAPAWTKFAIANLHPPSDLFGWVLGMRWVPISLVALALLAAVIRYGWKGFLLPVVYWAAWRLGFFLIRGVEQDWGWRLDWLLAFVGLLVAAVVAWLLAKRAGRGAGAQVLRWGGLALLLPLLAGGWASLAGPTPGAFEIVRALPIGAVRVVGFSLWGLLGQHASLMGLLLLLEGAVAKRPKRALISGTAVVALAWLGAAALFAGGLRFPAPQGRHYEGERAPEMTYALRAAAVSPTAWSFGVETIYPTYNEGLEEYLAEGRAAEPDILSFLDTTTDYRSLRQTPMGPAFDYLVSFREAHRAYDMQIQGLVTAVVARRRPLTAMERRRWLGLALAQPTLMTEDMILLANLVSDGRKDEALLLLEHIDAVVARIPEGWDAEPDARRLEQLEWLRGRVNEMPAWDGVERSLRVVLLGPTGEALTRVPVGVWQAGEIPFEDERDDGVPEDAWASARYQPTDANGEATFGGLGPGPYGVVAIGGWPAGELGMWELAIPEKPIPVPLPPGETVVVLRAIPQGYFSQVDDVGSYLLDSLPEGRLVLDCWNGRSAEYCGEGVMATGRRLPERPYWDKGRPAILEIDAAGRPTHVWIHEGLRVVAEKHASTLSLPRGE